MSDNFQQTVNLKEKMEKMKQAMAAPRPAPREKPAQSQPAKSKADEIDRLYRENGLEKESREDLRKISRPAEKAGYGKLGKNLIWLAALAIVAVSIYLIAVRNHEVEQVITNEGFQDAWYRIELTNGKVYYGQIRNMCSDMIEIRNVYYPYDQAVSGGQMEKTDDEASLKLVKLGKETYGPQGTINISRSQIVTLPLGDSSKVLKAILDYENASK